MTKDFGERVADLVEADYLLNKEPRLRALLARVTADRDAARAEVARLADLVSGLGYADPTPTRGLEKC